LSVVLSEALNLHGELEFLLQKLEARYLQLRSQQYAILMSDYLSNLHWLNEKHTFISQDVEFEGTVDGVDDIGRLKIITDSGVRYFGLKEVTYGY
jgi:BirA family biotin operon repressor/biotin-[acetyl-CoA-carboxylase] ligase